MTLKYGSSSNSKQAVRALNILLGLGNYQTFTKKAKEYVKAFQKSAGITADGIAGPKTLAALADKLPDVKYKDYSETDYVKAAQALVGSSIDGKYGSNTRANVIAFQTTAGINPTGDVNKNTWRALFDCPYTKDTVSIPNSGSGTNTKQPVDYKQYDKRWKSIMYSATGNKKQTIGSSGCGPTSMADILATWINSKITPVNTCEYSLKHGFRTANSGTAWGFFKSIANYYNFSKFVQTKSMATAREALRSGALVVSSMGPGYWTKGGHYICLWKTDDTYMYANDPASGTRKKQKLKAFEEQRKQFFIFYR